MGKVAFIFPGQGAQFSGMGKDLYDNYNIAKDIYEKADLVSGRKISELCFQGSDEDLKQTINTQPCIVTTSIAIYEVLKKELNIKPDYVAGHSLGEYCAMYVSGVLDFDTTIKAINKRAELMSSVQTGGMAAILNSTKENIIKAIEKASEYGYVDVANYNSPVQIVITGDKIAVEKAGELCLEYGARRVVPLAVSGAFHSKYMSDASKEFSEFVKDIEINDANIPVITNVDAQTTTNKEDFSAKMPAQIYSSVHWTQTIQKMAEDGVDTFIEIGPGSVLAGLNKKIVPELKTYSINSKDSLESFISEYKQKEVVC